MRNILIVLSVLCFGATISEASSNAVTCSSLDNSALHDMNLSKDTVKGYLKQGKFKADKKPLKIGILYDLTTKAFLIVDRGKTATKHKIISTGNGVFLENTGANIILWRLYNTPKKGQSVLVQMKTYSTGDQVWSWTHVYKCSSNLKTSQELLRKLL